MVWLNTMHSNFTPPKGSFGGSRCTCAKCKEKRSYKLDEEISKYLYEDVKTSKIKL